MGFEHVVVVNEWNGEWNCGKEMIGDQPRDGVSERVACVSFALLKGVSLVVALR